MNKIYKLVWSATTGCWSVASEFARKGKPGHGTQRLIIATGILISSGAAMADCTSPDSSGSTSVRTFISCTGNISSTPYKLTTPDTTLTFEEGSTLKVTGVGGKNALNRGDEVTLLEAFKADNTEVINKGSIEWLDATGYSDSYWDVAIGINKNGGYSGEDVSSSSFYNKESGKIIMTDTDGFKVYQGFTGIAVGSGGESRFVNDGVVNINVSPEASTPKITGALIDGENIVIENNKNNNTDENFVLRTNITEPWWIAGIYANAKESLHASNSGGIKIDGLNSTATAFNLYAGKLLNVDNSGSVKAVGKTHAEALSASIASGGHADINNKGILSATTDTANAYGIYITTPTTGSTAVITNTGKITSEQRGQDDTSGAGILLGAVEYSGDDTSSESTDIHIINAESGLISADSNAIAYQGSSDARTFSSAFIENSGVIQGRKAVNLYSGNDSFTQTAGTTTGDISMGDGDNSVAIEGGTVTGNITGGSGADTYSQSAGDVVGNLDAGDGFNDITLDGGTLTGNITTGAGDDIIFLSSGKYSGAVSTGAGDDLMYLGTSDASRSDVDISGLTRLDGGDNSDDIGDSLIVLRDLTGSTDSEGKAGDVHISGWENIDIGSEPVPADDLMARSAVESSAKTATLSLTGDLDVHSLKINSGSVLNLSDTTESAAVKGNLINAGTIDLTRQSSPSQTLSVTGNYTGSDALLKMNTVWNAPGDALGGNSQSDLLDITGTASGNTTVIPVSKDGRENVIDGDVRQVNHV
ncbi:ESPR-type extended signal peptide-containing protein, partial [Escherichia coli]|uniref:ESPR-type extended signal peptide-containing protein n=2 Tax=Escherichia coli TaxID=562 RepID=UPI0023E829C2